MSVRLTYKSKAACELQGTRTRWPAGMPWLCSRDQSSLDDKSCSSLLSLWEGVSREEPGSVATRGAPWTRLDGRGLVCASYGQAPWPGKACKRAGLQCDQNSADFRDDLINRSGKRRVSHTGREWEGTGDEAPGAPTREAVASWQVPVSLPSPCQKCLFLRSSVRQRCSWFGCLRLPGCGNSE